MTYHNRALIMSFVIHLLLIAAVVSAGSLMVEPCLLRVISFDIAKAGVKDIDLSAPPSTPLKKQCRIKRSEPLIPKKQKEIIPDEPVLTSPVSDVPLPEPVSPAKGEQVASLSAQEKNSNTLTGDGAGEIAVAGQQGGETAQGKYLREHFMYIRDRILSGIVYPNLARRMGWHGKVLTSFVIHMDGTVSDVKIVNSSGFKVLDENAVAAIKEVSPFPRPPTAARIIIPISYRLRPD